MIIKPKLSICIPAYNAGKWIEETVTSCMTDVEWPVEVIVSDNFSKDDTAKILYELCLKYPKRLKIVEPKSHLSMANNWNHVISHASGEYALLLSADDLLTAGMCNVAIAALDADVNVDVVSFEHDRLVHNEGGAAVIKRPVAKYLKSGETLNISKLLILNPLSINFSFFRLDSRVIKLCCVQDRLFARDLMTTDYDFWIRLLLNGAKIVYLIKPKGLYRVHQDNLSSAKRKMLIQTILVLGRHSEALLLRAGVVFRLLMLRLLLRNLILSFQINQRDNNKRILMMLLGYIFTPNPGKNIKK